MDEVIPGECHMSRMDEVIPGECYMSRITAACDNSLCQRG
jgi:hypothetical protein